MILEDTDYIGKNFYSENMGKWKCPVTTDGE